MEYKTCPPTWRLNKASGGFFRWSWFDAFFASVRFICSDNDGALPLPLWEPERAKLALRLG